MTTRISDLTLHAGLTIVKLDGFKNEDEASPSDPLGSANWFCEQYGMSNEGFNDSGIHWTDYDGWKGGPWDFSVLVASDEAEDVARFAKEYGYYVEGTEEITEPKNFGDGHGGTVEIVKHRDGWLILEN